MVELNIIEVSLKNIYGYYVWLLSVSDPRTTGWFLVDPPAAVLVCSFLYLIIVWLGPKIMENRQPFKLTSVLIFYNFAMFVLNAYICMAIFTQARKLKYSYICQPCRLSNNSDHLKLIGTVWLYYISKFIEFADTFFFILKKNDRQLTFLHVYHHYSMSIVTWVFVKWLPCGSMFLLPLVNSGIHVVMYLYYGLSALGPQAAKFLWWKKYLTILQLIQFSFGVALGVNSLIRGCSGMPVGVRCFAVVYLISYLILFGKFFVQSYSDKGKNIFYSIDTGCGQGVLLDENGKTSNYSNILRNGIHGKKSK